MPVKMLHKQAPASTRTQAPASRVRAAAFKSQNVSQQPASTQVSSAPLQLAASLAISLSLAWAQPQPAVAAQFNTLADINRAELAAVDADRNGIITVAELQKFGEKVAQEETFELPGPEALEFSHRLYDLNQDKQLTTDEMLTAFALDLAVMDDMVVDEVKQVFDKNTDGYVDWKEFKEASGDLGSNGEGLKQYVFNRVDSLGVPDNKLDIYELRTSLVLLRTAVLGY